MHGTISPDLAKIWEAQQNKIGKHGNTQSPTLYEKVLVFLLMSLC
jgi:condensin-2 complex subunit H2